MIVVVGLPYVMSFMSTRRSTKHVKKRLGSIQEELQKYFATADTLPEKTPDHLEPENAAQKRHSEENVHDELQRSLKTPSNLHSPWANFEFHVHFGFFEVAAIFFNQCIVLDLLNRNPFVGRRQRCPKLSFRRFFSFTV